MCIGIEYCRNMLHIKDTLTETSTKNTDGIPNYAGDCPKMYSKMPGMWGAHSRLFWYERKKILFLTCPECIPNKSDTGVRPSNLSSHPAGTQHAVVMPSS